MKELSLHILDLVQNSLHANATEVKIEIFECLRENLYQMKISDNGSGMSNEVLNQVLNPFFTTKKKKTGLGIPLLKQHAEMAGGKFSIESAPEKGTTISASFEHDHFDRQPIGDISATLISLIRAYPETYFIYHHTVDDKDFYLDTRDLKKELEGLPINSAPVLEFILDMLRGNLKELGIGL